ncbi:hypothetical protein [Rudanella lutea]|uniref:hypothetical protein n=1 Tax=Rudanella lutea TaxID=451374 RepID=UPI00036A99CF|nr:hypothetical protein [Rudanella lutea]
MKHFFMTMLAVGATSCQSDELSALRLVDQPGFLEVAVCSRGCYQYFLSVSRPNTAERWFPVNLDKELQQAALDYAIANQVTTDNRLPVVFTGTLLTDSTTIKTAGADDVPVPAFKARNIELTGIRKR